jgi:hypothetical protein
MNEVITVMKYKILIIIVAVLVLGISNGYAFNNSAPNFKCVQCHKGSVSIRMAKLQGLPFSYVPGETYMLTLILSSRVKSFGDVAGGFAIKASAGELRDTDRKNTQLSDGFLTHTKEGSVFRIWTFEWIAPSENKDVMMKVMGIAANGDFSPAGDKVGLSKYRTVPMQ